MAMQSDKGVFAIGCSRYPIIIDIRTLCKIMCVPMRHDGCGLCILIFIKIIVMKIKKPFYYYCYR